MQVVVVFITENSDYLVAQIYDETIICSFL